MADKVLTSEEDIKSDARDGVDTTKGESIYKKSVSGENIVPSYKLKIAQDAMNIPLLGNGSIQEEIEKKAHSISALDVENYTIHPNSDYGNSYYDQYANSREEYEDLNEVRAREQGLASKLAGGFGRYVGTTVLGTVGNIVGTVVGIGNGIKEAATKDGNAWSNFWNGYINNSVNEYVHDSIEEMNRIMPAYQSKSEKDLGVIESLFTGNFWANHMANMGWTSSSILSTVLTGGMGAASGVSNLARVLGVSKGAQSFLYRLVGGITGSFAEASTEAIDNYHDAKDSYTNAINQQQQDLEYRVQQEILQRFREDGYGGQKFDSDGRELPIIRNQRYEESVRNEIVNKYANEFAELENRKNTIENNAMSAARSTFGLNVAILGASNIIGVFSNIKVPMTNAMRVAKGSVTNMFRKQGSKIAASRGELLAREGLEALSQGMEEVEQKWASKTSEAYYGQEYNPETRKQLKDWLTVAGEQWNNTVGDKESWKEFMAGLFTSLIGVGGIKKVQEKGEDNKMHSKIKFDWVGGIGSMLNESKESAEISKQIYEDVNKVYNDVNLQRRLRLLTGILADKQAMENAATNNDKKAYIDAADNQMIRTIEAFADLGKLGDLRALIGKNDNLSDDELEKFVMSQVVPVTDENGNNTGKYTSDLGLVDINGEPLSNTEEGKKELRKRLKQQTEKELAMIDFYNQAIEKVDRQTGYQLDRATLSRFAWGETQAENSDKRINELLEKNKDIIKLGITGNKGNFSKAAISQINKTKKNIERELDRVSKKKDFEGKSEIIDNLNTALEEINNYTKEQDTESFLSGLITNNKVIGSILNTKIDDEHYLADLLFENLADKNLLSEDIKDDINDVIRLYRARNNYDQMVNEWAKNPQELIDLIDREAKVITDNNIRNIADDFNNTLKKNKIKTLSDFRNNFSRIAKEVGINDDNKEAVLKQASKSNKDLILYGESIAAEANIANDIQNTTEADDETKVAALSMLSKGTDLFQRLKYATKEQIVKQFVPNYNSLNKEEQELIERAASLIYQVKEKHNRSREKGSKDTAIENNVLQQKDAKEDTEEVTSNNSSTQTAQSSVNNSTPYSQEKVKGVLELSFNTIPEDLDYDSYYDTYATDLDNYSNTIKNSSAEDTVAIVNTMLQNYSYCRVFALHDPNFDSLAEAYKKEIIAWYSKSSFKTALPFDIVNSNNEELSKQYQTVNNTIKINYVDEPSYPEGTSIINEVTIEDDNGKLVQAITIGRNLEKNLETEELNNEETEEFVESEPVKEEPVVSIEQDETHKQEQLSLSDNETLDDLTNPTAITPDVIMEEERKESKDDTQELEQKEVKENTETNENDEKPIPTETIETKDGGNTNDIVDNQEESSTTAVNSQPVKSEVITESSKQQENPTIENIQETTPKDKDKKDRPTELSAVQNAIIFPDSEKYMDYSVKIKNAEERTFDSELVELFNKNNTWNYIYNGKLAEYLKNNPNAPLYFKYNKLSNNSVITMYVKDGNDYVLLGFFERRYSSKNGAYALLANLFDVINGGNAKYKQAFFKDINGNINTSNIDCTAEKNEDGYFTIKNTDGKYYSINRIVNGEVAQNKGDAHPVLTMKVGDTPVKEAYNKGEIFYGRSVRKGDTVKVYNGEKSMDFISPLSGYGLVVFKGSDGNYVSAPIQGRKFLESDISELSENKIIKGLVGEIKKFQELLNNGADEKTLLSLFKNRTTAELKELGTNLNNYIKTFNFKVAKVGKNIKITANLKGGVQSINLSTESTFDNIIRGFESLGVTYAHPTGINDSFIDFLDLSESDVINFQQVGKILTGFDKDEINEKDMKISDNTEVIPTKLIKSIDKSKYRFYIQGDRIVVQTEDSDSYISHQDLAVLLNMDYNSVDVSKVYPTVQKLLAEIITDFEDTELIRFNGKEYFYIEDTGSTIETLFDIKEGRAIKITSSMRSLLKNNTNVIEEKTSENIVEKQPETVQLENKTKNNTQTTEVQKNENVQPEVEEKTEIKQEAKEEQSPINQTLETQQNRTKSNESKSDLENKEPVVAQQESANRRRGRTTKGNFSIGNKENRNNPLFNGKSDNYNAIELLGKINNSYIVKLLKQVLPHSTRITVLSNEDFDKRYNQENSEKVINGLYDPKLNSIIVPLRVNNSTILHELVHSVTNNLMQNPEASSKIKEVYKSFTLYLEAHPEFDKITNKGTTISYAATDLHEFIAELFANDETAKALQQIPADYAVFENGSWVRNAKYKEEFTNEENRDKVSQEASKKSILDRIIDTIIEFITKNFGRAKRLNFTNSVYDIASKAGKELIKSFTGENTDVGTFSRENDGIRYSASWNKLYKETKKLIDINSALLDNANVLLSTKKFVNDMLNKTNELGQVDNLINQIQTVNATEAKTDIVNLIRSIAGNKTNADGIKISSLYDNEIMEQYFDSVFGVRQDIVYKNIEEMLEMFKSSDFCIQIQKQAGVSVKNTKSNIGNINKNTNFAQVINDKINECN